VVKNDGTSEEITFPKFPIDHNVSTTRIVGTLAENGLFDGSLTEEVRGTYQSAMRNDFRHPIDSATRVNGAHGIARSNFDGAGGVQPPERLPDFIAWLRLVATDDTRLIMLERSGPSRP